MSPLLWKEVRHRINRLIGCPRQRLCILPLNIAQHLLMALKQGGIRRPLILLHLLLLRIERIKDCPVLCVCPDLARIPCTTNRECRQGRRRRVFPRDTERRIKNILALGIPEAIRRVLLIRVICATRLGILGRGIRRHSLLHPDFLITT